MKKKNLVMFLVMFLMFIVNVDAAFMRDYEVKHTNPNGKVVNVYLTGDEYFRYAHDKNGYVLIKNEEGYYTYATLSNGVVVSSNNIYDMKSVPSNKITKDDINLEKNPNFVHHFDEIKSTNTFKSKNIWTQKDGSIENVLEFNNLVVFFRFKGESEYINSTLINNLSHVLGTTNSDSTGLKSYVYKVSEGKVDLNNTVLQTSGTTYYSYTYNYARGYLQPYSSSNTIGYSSETEGNIRLLDMLNAVLSAMPETTSSVLDGDGDGVIDNVIFILSGSPDTWDDALWPHKWSLNAKGGAVTFSGVKGGTYNLQFVNDLLSTSSSTISSEVAVFSHETMHSLGIPDLYRYYDNYYGGDPVYKWDMMNYDQEGTYVTSAIRNRYGFTKINGDTWSREPQTITESGEYQLNLTALNNGVTSYKIETTDSKQYIQLEYRGTNGIYDSKIPYSGLLISRINTNYSGNAGTESNPYYDEYYIFRPNETGIYAAGGDKADAALKPCNVLSGCNVNFGNQSDSASITNRAIVLTNGTNTKLYIKDVYKDSESTIKFKVFLNGDKAYLNIKNYNGKVGNSFTLTPIYGSNSSYTPVYTSLDSSVATVDQNGKVSLVGAGTTTINVKIGTDNLSATVISNPSSLNSLTASLISPNEVRVEYNVDGANISEYVIYRSEENTDSFEEIGRVSTTYFVDSTVSVSKVYTYKIGVVIEGEVFSFTETVTIDTSDYLPGKITNLSFQTNSIDSATLNFDTAKNSDGYNIYVSDNIIGPYTLLNSTVNNTYTFESLDPAKNYFIKVAGYRHFAENDYEGQHSDIVVINTREYLLYPPTINKVEVISNNQVRINFSSIENATGYNIWVSTDNKNYTKLASNISNTTYIHEGVKFGQTYYYKVSSVLLGGYNGYKSNEYKILVNAVTPQNPKAASLTYNSINISYNMVENADGYEIQYSTDKKTWKKLTTTTSLNYTHKSLTYNKTYYYKVRSYKKVNGSLVYSNYTSIVNAKPLSQAPTISLTQLDDGVVKLTYKSDSSATSYKIYKKSILEDNYTLLATTSKTTYTIKNLTLGETVSFKVVAYKSSIKGGETEIEHNVTISSPTLKLNEKTLSWSSVKDATSYSLYKCDDTCNLLINTPELTYTSDLVDNEKIHYYYVVASNDKFTSFESAYVTNIESFTTKIIMNYSTNTNAASFVVSSSTKFDGYELYMSSSKSGKYTKVASASAMGTGSIINYTKATYNKTLYYKVRPYIVINGKKVYGTYSSVKSFKNILNNIPLKITNISNNSIKIDWDKITSATRYELYYSINGSKYTKVKLTTNTYTHKNLTFGDEVNYYVRAILSIGGKTYYGDSKSYQTKANVESTLVDYSITNLLNGSVKITTETSKTYYIKYSKDESYNNVLTFVGNTYTINDLDSGSLYNFIVGEYNNGVYGQSNHKEIYVLDNLEAPTLNVKYDSSTSVTIFWDDLGSNMSYKVYLEGNKIYEGTNTSITEYNLIPGKPYEYEIEVTYNDGIKNITSSKKSVIVRTLPDIINDFNVTINSSLSSITVKANPVSTATYYYLLYRNSTKEDYKILAGHNEPNFVNVKVSPGKTYYLKIASARDYNGKLFYSTQSNSKTIKIIPETVSGISVKNVSYNSNKITWNKISGITGYEVYYSTDNKSFKKATTTTANSYTHKSLTTGKTYYYKVRAYKTISKKNYYGNYSSISSIKAIPSSPTGIKASRYNYSSKMNTVSWSKVSGASGYTIYSSFDGYNYKTLGSTTSLSYIDKNASSSGTYYKIKAYRTVSGKKVYSQYSEEYYMRAPLSPTYSVYISSNTYSSSTATPMIITNNGKYSMKILSKNAFLLDSDTTAFDRKMHLINTDTYKTISSTTCPKDESTLIAFEYTSTWVDMRTTYYFDFIYDGVKYQAQSSNYYGNTYIRYS